jgi:hypothetical protein
MDLFAVAMDVVVPAKLLALDARMTDFNAEHD